MTEERDAARRILEHSATREQAPSWADMETVARALLADDWQPIETAPPGEDVIRYEPATYGREGRIANQARIVISTGNYPRKATHWRPLPAPPEGGE